MGPRVMIWQTLHTNHSTKRLSFLVSFAFAFFLTALYLMNYLEQVLYIARA